VAGDVHILGVDVDPVLVQRSIQSNCFENNVTFQLANVLCDKDRCSVINSYLLKKDKVRFDVVFCFSVTMWIHLNHGDEGLKNFLQYVASITDFLLIEPQPWRCYQTAARRMRKLDCTPYEHMSTLQWRDKVVEEIINYLESDCCSMKRIQSFGQTESWERPLCLFRSLKVT
jgi:Bicoid-interacting protein 3 (Bin3)